MSVSKKEFVDYKKSIKKSMNDVDVTMGDLVKRVASGGANNKILEMERDAYKNKYHEYLQKYEQNNMIVEKISNCDDIDKQIIQLENELLAGMKDRIEAIENLK